MVLQSRLPLRNPFFFSEQEPPRAGGFADRVSDALRMAMAKVERPRRDVAEGASSIPGESDPELGQNQRKTQKNPTTRGRENGGPGYAARGRRKIRSRGSNRSSSISSDSSSSASSSSSSGTSSSSRSSGSSGSDRSEIAGSGDARLTRGGDVNKSSSLRKHNKKAGRSVVNLRSSSAMRRDKSSRDRREKRRRRTQRSSRRHYSRRRKVDARRRSEAYSSRQGGSIARRAAGDGLVVLGRQAVASVAKIAFRVVLGSWKGVTTAAFKAVRTWQVGACTGEG